MTRLFSALCLTALSALPLAAQSGHTQPAVAQVMPGWVQPNGNRVVGLHIKLAPGWKTYWRAPGDAGIPPRFDWSRSRNLRGVAISWPTPGVYPQNGMRTIGYKDEVVIPVTIAPRNPGKPVRLRVGLDIGVCEDICVPYQMEVSAVLDSTDTKPTPAIAAALADRPYSGAEAGVRAAVCKLSPKGDGMEIEARLSMPSTGGREVVVIEPGQPGLWMSETDVARSGGTLTATGDLVPTSGSAVAIDRSAITITVLGAQRAVEIKGCAPG
ncbi:MAG: protein-disulfide reductase DsbD domain-containing protein [Pseudomonadota bacterium]